MCLLLLSLFFCFIGEVFSHGRLIEPPARTSAWRFGFGTPANYNDHETNCGGFSRQWSKNGGRCGMCGDAWDLPTPRDGEAGGKYGRGVVVRNYSPGQTIKISVDITANHKGYFQFRLCPQSNPNRPASESCFKMNILKISGGGDKFYIGTGTGTHSVHVQLPAGVKCATCVLQWQYVAGNNWGTCPDGSGQVGCGPQEEFRACADISIGQGSQAGTNSKPSKPNLGSWPFIQRPSPRPTSATTTRRPWTATSWWQLSWPWSWGSWGRSNKVAGDNQDKYRFGYRTNTSYFLSSLTKNNAIFNLTGIAARNITYSEDTSIFTLYTDLCKLITNVILSKINNFFTLIF